MMFAALRQKLKGWKTVVINAIIGAPASLYFLYQQFQGVDVTPLLPAKYVAAFIAIWAVLGVVLRIVTTGPVGAKGDAPPPADVKAGD